MCGIGVTIRTTPSTNQSIEDDIRHAIWPRGPDFQAEQNLVIQRTSENLQIQFFASVLHLRGLTLTQQPIKAPETGSLLLWNGEVFDGLAIPDTYNDGQVVLETLERRGKQTIPEIFVQIEGPYAFIYYDASLNQIWFGRDPLGRRSLMMLERETSASDSLIGIASHFESTTFWRSYELDTNNLFYIDLQNPESHLSIRQVPRGSLKILLNRQIPLESDRVSLDNSDNPYPSTLTTAANQLRDSLDISLQRRLRSISTCYQADKHQSQVAILFSGGIDCTTLALLAHFHIPPSEPIDLINVAFEKPCAVSHSKSGNNTACPDVFSVPDRHTGEASWKELCQLTPGRIWRFVKVDVWMVEYLKYKNQIIKLIHPNTTVMDLSIAAPLFFAARGIGSSQLNNSPLCQSSSTRPYRSSARVFLSGLGADELLGGYSRHRSAFSTDSPWINLINELQLDIDRIPTRNLGRDDRIISYHGREVRYPFLDRQVIDILAALPVHLKCDFALEKGAGDKLLLRVLAYQLGLKQASKLVKRAIQFGARSPKFKKFEKGTDDIKLCEDDQNSVINTGRMCSWNSLWSRARSVNSRAKEIYAKLQRTQEDIRTGLFPASLQVSQLIFSSFSARQTIILGYPSHIEKTASLASNSRPIVVPPKPCYQVTHILNKGMGIIATERIMPGTLILSERPVLILPERLEAPSREILDEVHLIAFDELCYEDQKAIASLVPAIPDEDSEEGHALVNRIWNNEICIPITQVGDGSQEPYPYSAVYPTTSRFNHSCSPNSRWHFDPSSFSLQLSPVRQIEPGEEITVSYIDHLHDRNERQDRLKSKWGFQCNCTACDVTNKPVALVQASDARRKQLSVEHSFAQELLDADLPKYVSKDQDRSKLLMDRMEKALGLLQEENLYEEIARFGRALARLYHHCRRYDLAKSIAEKALPIVRAVDGVDSPGYIFLQSIICFC